MESVKHLEMRSPWWVLNATPNLLIRDRKEDTEGKAVQRWRQRSGWFVYKPRRTRDCQKPAEARRKACIGVPLGASGSNQPCQHLDFGLPAPELCDNSFLLFSHVFTFVSASPAPAQGWPQLDKPEVCLNQNFAVPLILQREVPR